ncbi:MAG: hypothetical protein L6W00_22345 [Lentisphaeria bacterium]|nr:MAG: hypothetical protein L6W00_22345 [Lentisphaeria bacterium]
MATSGHKFDRRLILIAALAIVLLLGFAGYRSLRLGAGRLFGDFFYPYLELLRSGVDAVSDQSLLLYSRAQLAARLEQLQETNRQLAVQAAASGELFREKHLAAQAARPTDPGRLELLRRRNHPARPFALERTVLHQSRQP